MVCSGGLNTDVDAATFCPAVPPVVDGLVDIVRSGTSSREKNGNEILPVLGFGNLVFLRDQSDSCNLLCAVGLEKPEGFSRDPVGCL